jgi:FtsZ-interacting cell division protein ZipA
MSTVLIIIVVIVVIAILAVLLFGGKRRRQKKVADRHLDAAADSAATAERERVRAEHHRERARDVDPRVDN